MQEFNNEVSSRFGVNIRESEEQNLPGSEEELGIHMQLNYKQEHEIALEQ